MNYKCKKHRDYSPWIFESSVCSVLDSSLLSALKIYKVKGADPSNTIFAASSNYVYDTELNSHAVPFGDAGFVVVRKSGDAGVYKKKQATPAGYDNNAERFQAEIGALPGAVKGGVAPGDAATVLAGPP